MWDSFGTSEHSSLNPYHMKTQDNELVMVEEYNLTKKLYGPALAKIVSSKDVHSFLSGILTDTWKVQEHFYAFYLDRSNSIIGYQLHTIGGISGCIVDNRLILSTALLAGASCIIVAHNHPSGNTRPSEADIKITELLKTACKYLNINLLDHIIYCGPDSYFSFADEGLITA